MWRWRQREYLKLEEAETDKDSPLESVENSPANG